MRAKILEGILLLVTFMVFSLITVSHASAMRYIGQISWTATLTEDESGPITPVDFPITVGISQMGGSYYIAQGIATAPPSGAPVILSGGGQIVDSDLVLTMSGFRNNVPWVESSSLYVKVNQTSLNGIFQVISNNFNPSTHMFNSSYVAGTLATSTPIPLTTGTPPLSLLLDE
jgi:hypothetical protein